MVPPEQSLVFRASGTALFVSPGVRVGFGVGGPVLFAVPRGVGGMFWCPPEQSLV